MHIFMIFAFVKHVKFFAHHASSIDDKTMMDVGGTIEHNILTETEWTAAVTTGEPEADLENPPVCLSSIGEVW